MLTTAQIEEILSQFDIELSNFEIVNIEEKKGWSAKYLYLIVEQNEQYVLKGKSPEQLDGYMTDIEISAFLKAHGFSARSSIKTKTGDFHFVEDYVHWDLKTYIPGSVEDFINYTDESVLSLAQVNTSYINTSLNNSELQSLNIEKRDLLDTEEIIQSLKQYKDVLHSVIGHEPEKFLDWFRFAKEELKNIFAHNPDFSLVHNDLNNKNVLLDLHANKVTAFIDWDHGCISSPLKDIIEPLNMFYDFVPEKYDHMRELYIKEIKANYPLKITDAELNLLQVYFYALNKWKYINLFAKLIHDLGNSTDELAMFEETVRFQMPKLNDLGKRYGVF